MDWLTMLSKLNLPTVVTRTDGHEDYISQGGKYAWVFQCAQMIASIVVDLLERAETTDGAE